VRLDDEGRERERRRGGDGAERDFGHRGDRHTDDSELHDDPPFVAEWTVMDADVRRSLTRSWVYCFVTSTPSTVITVLPPTSCGFWSSVKVVLMPSAPASNDFGPTETSLPVNDFVEPPVTRS